MRKLACLGFSPEEKGRVAHLLRALAHLLPARWEMTASVEEAQLILVAGEEHPEHVNASCRIVPCGAAVRHGSGAKRLSLPPKPHELFALLQDASLEGPAAAPKGSDSAQVNREEHAEVWKLKAWPLDWWRWPAEELLVVARLSASSNVSSALLFSAENQLVVRRALQRLRDQALLETEVQSVREGEQRKAPTSHWWNRAYDTLRSLLSFDRAA